MTDERGPVRKRLDVWAEEGGVMLKLTQAQPHRIVIEIIHPNAGDPSKDRVLAAASIASFRWQRIADYFTNETKAREQDATLAAAQATVEAYAAELTGAMGEIERLKGVVFETERDLAAAVTRGFVVEQERDRLREQRDALVAALRKVEQKAAWCVEYTVVPGPQWIVDLWYEVRAALAEVESSATGG